MFLKRPPDLSISPLPGASFIIRNEVKSGIYFPCGHCPETSQIPMFLHISASCISLMHTNKKKIVGFYVKTTINLQGKCLCTLDFKYMWNMFLDFICTWQTSYANNFTAIWMKPTSMKETKMPPVHAAPLVANSDNTTYEVESIK